MPTHLTPTTVLESFHTGCPVSGVFLVTGERGAGKTTWLLKLVEAARSVGFTLYGLLSPGVFEKGEKQSIQLVNLASGEKRIMSALAPPHLHAGPGNLVEHGKESMVLGGWALNAETVAWGNELIKHWMQPSQALGEPPKSILIIDELGPLEFIHGKGFTAALQLSHILNTAPTSPYFASFLVVRPGLLERALEHWPHAQILKIPNWRSNTQNSY